MKNYLSLSLHSKVSQKTLLSKQSTDSDSFKFMEVLTELLSTKKLCEKDLLKIIVEDFGFTSLYFHYFMEALNRKGLLSFSLEKEGRTLALLEPMKKSPLLKDWNPLEMRMFSLSRFAYMRRDGEDLLLENPLSSNRLWIKDSLCAAIIFSLSKPHSFSDLQKIGVFLNKKELQALLTLIQSMSALTWVDKSDQYEEEKNIPLHLWEFHDLLFHSRSRLGRHNYSFGGIFPYDDELFPPVVKSFPKDQKKIFLEKFDLKKISSPPFHEVVEKRFSNRQGSTKPLTFSQISEFLYRSARIKTLHNNGRYPCSKRPYPGGGAMYELEIYLGLHNLEIDPDLYYYHPLDHTLIPMGLDAPELLDLREMAYRSTGQEKLPHIPIIITARFQRMSWKYRSMAYATILKNVGVLYENFYLTASAMNLAACGLGGGNSDSFAKIAKLNYYEETSVGEFLLGNP